MTPDAYEQALSDSLNESAPNTLKFPIGLPYVPPAMPTSQSESQEKRPTAHIEEEGFTGDRVLANSILFKMEYSWWIEAAYAIPEGDIGRVWEIMKVSLI